MLSATRNVLVVLPTPVNQPTPTHLQQDTSISDHLHYLGTEFGAAELEGEIAALQMQSLALDRAVAVEVEAATGGDTVVGT